MCKTKVMILGSFHFNQEGIEYLDILSNKRQKEVLEIVESINKFKPTKVAVEWLPEYVDLLDQKYQKFYEDGIIDVRNVGDSNVPLAYGVNDVDERVMLGFQIAKKITFQKYILSII